MAFHVSDLGQHGEDQLPDAPTNGAEAVNVHGDAFVDKEADGGLNVQCVPAETVNRIDMNHVAGPNLTEQVSEARPLSRQRPAAYAFVAELLIEVPANSEALALNALVPGADAIVGDAVHGWLIS